MAKALIHSNYYRIPCDTRDQRLTINFSPKEIQNLNKIEDYNSHNTQRLDVEGMKEQLMRLRFIQADLGLIEQDQKREIRSE